MTVPSLTWQSPFPSCQVQWINEEKQHGIVATRNIMKGEIIFSEEPIGMY